VGVNSAGKRLLWFLGLVVLSGLLLITGVSVMIERVDMGQHAGPVAFGLFIASMVVACSSIFVLAKSDP
jgi:hypothetical protein